MVSKIGSLVIVVIVIAVVAIAGVFLLRGGQSPIAQPTATETRTTTSFNTSTSSPTAISATTTNTNRTSTNATKVTLYISHWGFSWDQINSIVIEPFEKKYNVDVVLLSGTSADRYAKLVEGAQPTPDIIFLPDYYAYMAASKGLLEELNTSRLSNYGKIAPFILESYSQSKLSKYAVPHTIQDMVLVYRSDKHAPVSSITDVWRNDFSGFVLLPYITATSGPMMLTLMNLALNGSINDPTPALQAIKDHKSSVATFYTSSAQFSSMFERGEAEIGVGLRYQLGALQGLNQTLGGKLAYAIPKEGSIFVLNVMAIPKNSTHKDLAYALMDFWLSAEVQQKLAESGVDAPVNSEVSLPPGHFFNYSGQIVKPIYLLPETLASNLANWTALWKQYLGS